MCRGASQTKNNPQITGHRQGMEITRIKQRAKRKSSQNFKKHDVNYSEIAGSGPGQALGKCFSTFISFYENIVFSSSLPTLVFPAAFFCRFWLPLPVAVLHGKIARWYPA